MIKRIIEISSPCYCSLKLDNFILSKKDEKPVSLPLEDLGCIIIDHPAVTFTTSLLVSLAEHNIAVLFCGASHVPHGVLLPYESHHIHTKIIKAQASIKEPKKKRVWQEIIKTKIKEQSKLLEKIGKKNEALKIEKYIARVSSGDKENIEGVVAAIYFKEVFGKDFKREYQGALSSVNPMLNYGYALIRSLTIRAICAAGLHPALGIFHKNQFNPFCLGDDLMEIFRPLVDFFVYNLHKQGEYILDSATKKKLLEILLYRIEWKGVEVSILVGTQKMAQSISQFILGEKEKIYLPKIL